jgi:hypothetical protein
MWTRSVSQVIIIITMLIFVSVGEWRWLHERDWSEEEFRDGTAALILGRIMDYTSISGTRKSHQMHVYLIRGETNHLPIKSSILSKKKKKYIILFLIDTLF